MFDRPKPTVGCSANGRRRKNNIKKHNSLSFAFYKFIWSSINYLKPISLHTSKLQSNQSLKPITDTKNTFLHSVFYGRLTKVTKKVDGLMQQLSYVHISLSKLCSERPTI